MTRRPLRILFVCLGNICRSPIAEGVFRHHIVRGGLTAHIEIASAGTGDWHVGKPPDARMCATALGRGVDISGQRARTLASARDLEGWDHILVMDRQNLANTRRLAQTEDQRARIALFRDFDPEPEDGEVPDPYYGAQADFDLVYEIVDRTGRALLEHLRREHGL